MLLHTFHVDTGSMITFDINLALENVSRLKEEIERKCRIPCDKQVLLASGGQHLEPNERVSTYFAGTETSPIFLFSKNSIESSAPPLPTIQYGPDADMDEETSSSLDLPPTISTVRDRCLLAQKFCDLAKEQLRICDSLVHDQHLQQQGWAAVVANLDDITVLFKSRSESFHQNFKQHLETRDQYGEILESFEGDMETLSKIPVLPALLECEGEEGAATQHGPLTLLQWISAKDQQASLQQLAEQCRKGMNQFDSKVLETLMSEVNSVVETASSQETREIKGLAERLYGLEKLRLEVNNIVTEQTDRANAFVQNQNSVTNLGGDKSILPDLCRSHKEQLRSMLENHKKLRDIRQRCIKSKQEVSENLFYRLKWIMFVESRIFESDSKLLMYHESVKKLQQHLEVLQQLHTAPSMYLTAVAEVVRRRTFSQAFLMWGNEVSCQVCAVHSEEVARRKLFHSQFQGHFLSSLFPGLDDLPPPFATHPPPMFDSNLPKLSMEDVESLRSQLPDLALSLSIPDLASITQFFLTRSKSEATQPQHSIHDKIVEVVGGLATNLDAASLLQPTDNSQSSAQSATQPISDRGFESETDTEDLENITPSHCEVPLLKKGRKRKEGGDVSELKKASVCETVSNLRREMEELKGWVLNERSQLKKMFDRLTLFSNQRHQQLLKELEMKESAMNELRDYSEELEEKVKKCLEQEEVERERRERLVEEAKRETAAAVRDEMAREHHSEIEALRARYRLYTSQHVPDSPSPDSTHDKTLDRGGEYIEKSEHEEILKKKLEDLKAEYESQMQRVTNEIIQRYNKKETQEKTANRYQMSVEPQPMEAEQERAGSPQTIVSSSSISIVSSEPESRRCDVATGLDSSPHTKTKDKLTKSTTSVRSRKLSTASCNDGDSVVVVWDDCVRAYIILQESSTLHFLHKDSLERLGLKESSPQRQYCLGEVVQKEYCQAKKDGNRYNVPAGSRFYRVKVDPCSFQWSAQSRPSKSPSSKIT